MKSDGGITDNDRQSLGRCKNTLQLGLEFEDTTPGNLVVPLILQSGVANETIVSLPQHLRKPIESKLSS